MNNFATSLLKLLGQIGTSGVYPEGQEGGEHAPAVERLEGALAAFRGQQDSTTLLNVLDAVHQFALAVPERRGKFYQAFMNLPCLNDAELLSQWLQAATDPTRLAFQQGVRKAIPLGSVLAQTQFDTGKDENALVLRVYIREEDLERNLSLPLFPFPGESALFKDDLDWLTFTLTDITRFFKHLGRRVERGELFGAALRSHQDHLTAEKLVVKVAQSMTQQERALLARYPEMLMQVLRS